MRRRWDSSRAASTSAAATIPPTASSAAAPVVLRELRIGQYSLYDVDAAVNQAPIGISLLGMSFLDRLAGYEVDDGRLILRW